GIEAPPEQPARESTHDGMMQNQRLELLECPAPALHHRLFEPACLHLQRLIELLANQRPGLPRRRGPEAIILHPRGRERRSDSALSVARVWLEIVAKDEAELTAAIIQSALTLFVQPQRGNNAILKLLDGEAAHDCLLLEAILGQ